MENQKLRVGFGREDITPDFSVPLAGYGNTLLRMSRGWLTRLYSTCIAVTDDKDNTVLFFTIDLIRISDDIARLVRDSVNDALGIPKENIMLSAIHTHSAPDVGQTVLEGSEFYNLFIEKTLAAAKAALDDREESTVKIGRSQVEGLAYERHYLFDNGKYVGDNFGDPKDGNPVEHADKTDNDLQLIRFVRAGDKKDIILANWQAHPTVTSTGSYDIARVSYYLISADYIDPCRSYIEDKCGVHFAFFQGAAGNINPKSMIPEENPTNYYVRYGTILGDFIIKGLEGLYDVDSGDVKITRRMLTCYYDHSDDGRVEDAQKIAKVWLEKNDRTICRLLGEPYGIHSAYHAGSIIRRSKLGISKDVELDAIRIGDISFVTAPYEMFCTNGMYVKEHSPYKMTFILSCTNDFNIYFASERAFEHGCYEVDSREFERGTAEKAVNCFLEMLNELNNT